MNLLHKPINQNAQSDDISVRILPVIFTEIFIEPVPPNAFKDLFDLVTHASPPKNSVDVMPPFWAFLISGNMTRVKMVCFLSL